MTNGTLEPAPIPVIVHLSGARRGTTQRLRGDTLTIGTDPDVDVHVAHEPMVGSHHSSLVRSGDSYELQTDPEHPVWVNGELSNRRLLKSGDVLEIGPDGPILRFRLYPAGSGAYKSPSEAFADCLECARYSSSHPVGRAATFLSETPRELATQTSRTFRVAMVAAIVVLVALVGLLAQNYSRLEDRVEREAIRVTGISELVERSDQDLEPEDLARLGRTLSSTLERVEALEARKEAPTRIVATASRSVALLQGSYGFIDPATERPLRFDGTGADGLPLRDKKGAPLVGLGGDGPLVEALFTGTAFVATPDGLLLTNRHVALPWAHDDVAREISAQGLTPRMLHFIGYLPGTQRPFDVALVAASDRDDLAVLRCRPSTALSPALPLALELPAAGDEVIVLGYPTGIRALLARADADFVEQLSRDPGIDFWTVAARLASAGHIAPLASRGIIAQVTRSTVVYDAETTRGGSGGPVLDLEGEVVGISSAIVPEFGGSNLGVPAEAARRLLLSARLAEWLPFSVH